MIYHVQSNGHLNAQGLHKKTITEAHLVIKALHTLMQAYISLNCMRAFVVRTARIRDSNACNSQQFWGLSSLFSFLLSQRPKGKGSRTAAHGKLLSLAALFTTTELISLCVSVCSTQRVFTPGKGYEKLNKASNENEFAVCRRNSYSRVSSFLIAVILPPCSSAPLGPLFLCISLSLSGCRGLSPSGRASSFSKTRPTYCIRQQLVEPQG